MPAPPTLLESSPVALKSTPKPEQLGSGYPPDESVAIRKALEWALTAAPEKEHEALAVAQVLEEILADAPTVQAALLVDSGKNREVLSQAFGTQVVQWVEKVIQLEQLACPQAGLTKPRQAEMWRRLLLALANGVRPLLIFLARRLVALRAALAHPEAQRKLAQEAQTIHAALASRLGVHRLKWELEDLAFRILEPTTYRELAQRLEAKRSWRESYIQDFTRQLKDALKAHGIAANVQGRPKHLYSIFKKMQRKQLDLSELYDLNAVRVIVADIPTCYQALALAHELWEPILEEYDDYIAHPKDNGYQSLHTVVKGPQGLAVEIQIRTEAMHTLAEYGVAAHWLYKEGGRRDPALEHTISALRRSLKTDSEGDWFAGQVFVLTPKSEVICLPQGATPIDFAYAIHTEVGHRCRGARVDGRIVPLDYALKNGEKVEILTAKEGGPNRSWLKVVKTDHARHRIRQWFKQKATEAFRHLGKMRLERELDRLALKAIHWPSLLQRFRLNRPEELWLALGRGEITRGQLVTALRLPTTPSSVTPASLKDTLTLSQKTGCGVKIQGENLLTQLARCCRPCPGDAVVGYLTVHHRITIHRRDCPNVANLPESRRHRLIDATWE